VATILMIFLKINCPNYSRLVLRPPYLPYRFRRHWRQHILGVVGNVIHRFVENLTGFTAVIEF